MGFQDETSMLPLFGAVIGLEITPVVSLLAPSHASYPLMYIWASQQMKTSVFGHN